MTGYSGTPLVKKLGIKSRSTVAFINAPADFVQRLGLPPDVLTKPRLRQLLDFALLFVKSEKQLNESFSIWASRLKPDGMIWVAWPKQSSGVLTDLSFTNVQAIGLAGGLVDTKICAIDDVWSGLRFVFRLKDRPRLGRN